MTTAMDPTVLSHHPLGQNQYKFPLNCHHPPYPLTQPHDQEKCTPQSHHPQEPKMNIPLSPDPQQSPNPPHKLKQKPPKTDTNTDTNIDNEEKSTKRNLARNDSDETNRPPQTRKKIRNAMMSDLRWPLTKMDNDEYARCFNHQMFEAMTMFHQGLSRLAA